LIIMLSRSEAQAKNPYPTVANETGSSNRQNLMNLPNTGSIAGRKA